MSTVTDQDAIRAAVAALLPNASIEYPGFIWHPSDLVDHAWAFGTANTAWGGDLNNVETGDPVLSVELIDGSGVPIPSTSADADAISDAILRAMSEGETIAAKNRTHPGASWHYVTHPTQGRVLVSVPNDEKPAAAVAVVLVSVVCPACGFGLNHITSPDRQGPYADALVSALAAVCESCGEEIAILPEAVHDAQHECLRLLGEA